MGIQCSLKDHDKQILVIVRKNRKRGHKRHNNYRYTAYLAACWAKAMSGHLATKRSHLAISERLMLQSIRQNDTDSSVYLFSIEKTRTPNLSIMYRAQLFKGRLS